MSRYDLGSIVSGNKTLWRERSIPTVGIYTGLMSELKQVAVKWTVDEDSPDLDWEYITLNEIVAQVTEHGETGVITVIEDDPLHGEIYRYGNHGAYWELTGITSGYA